MKHSQKFLYTPEKIPRDNTARTNENSTNQIFFSTSKWKFDQANAHLFPFIETLKGQNFDTHPFFDWINSASLMLPRPYLLYYVIKGF